MTRIIPLRYSDMEKVRKMIEYVSPDISKDKVNGETFVYFPFNGLHELLPISMKFLQECYVAVEGEELLGLISLVPDGSQKTRWKINRLILNPNAYDAGKQLIDYVVNKYGGAGVETFLTTIDENYTEALALFKTACSFRNCSKINIWEYENLKNYKISENNLSLRAAELSDAKKLFELDCQTLYPKFKTALVKTEKDFRFDAGNNLINKLKGHKIKRFVLDNPQKGTIESFLSVMTRDNVNFWIDITLSLAYQEYYEDILNFAINRVCSINQNGKLYIGVRDFQQTSKKMTEVLSQHDFKQRGNFEVLVKDYWRPAEYKTENKAPIMIFPDMTSPACNIVQFIKEF